jgi:hypothetical protein
LAALTSAVKSPVAVGVPETIPVAGSTARPSGRPVAVKPVGWPSARIRCANGVPVLARTAVSAIAGAGGTGITADAIEDGGPSPAARRIRERTAAPRRCRLR